MRLAESYSIRVDGTDIGTIQKSPAGWFWYGLGHNTLARDWEESKYASREYKRVFSMAEEALEDFTNFYKTVAFQMALQESK